MLNRHSSTSVNLREQVDLAILNDAHAILSISRRKVQGTRLQEILLHGQYNIQNRLIFGIGQVWNVPQRLAKEDYKLVIIGVDTLH